MKIFLWANGVSESDFTDVINCVMPDSSNAHSGGCVVLAETEEEAIELLKKYTGKADLREKTDNYESAEPIDTKPVLVPLEQKGVVLYCDGDC